jgi:hypothetical protein
LMHYLILKCGVEHSVGYTSGAEAERSVYHGRIRK